MQDDDRVEALTQAEAELFLRVGDHLLDLVRITLVDALPEAEGSTVLTAFDDLVRRNPAMTALSQVMQANDWGIIDGPIRAVVSEAIARLGSGPPIA